ncbi:MAG TPA: PEP-utilizing enzyme [Candidatus Limnocylindrales bacterium]|nr:PEP-utilizing enzyme [Candidatus Limnocylindrales bacterium]
MSEPAPTSAEDFPVVFDDPADALETWERDDMHMPFALTPLAADFIRYCVGGGFNPQYEAFGVKQRLHTGIWHGWAYFSWRANVPESEAEAASAQWVEACRARIPTAEAYWRDEALPELRRIYDGIAAIPVDDLSREELARAWEDAWADVTQSWVIHFMSIRGPYQVLEDLSDAYAAAMGPGRDAEALMLAHGGHHELEEVEAGVERLTALVATDALATAVVDAAKGDVLAPLDMTALRALAGGHAFIDALVAFLAEHGHLGQNHDDLRLASWTEAPRLLLGRIATRLGNPAPPSAEREAGLRARAAELEATVRETLRDKPEELAAFDRTLGYARAIGWLTEGHNYWIDRLSHARLRALSRRVGARLAREGIIEAADDVFFLTRDEVAAALREGTSRQALVAERRAEHAVNERRTAPQFVGKVPDEPPTGGDRFDVPRVVSAPGDTLSGKGASAGIVRGPARVTLSQDDFGRIQPGDIIVCPASNPSWVPIFTIAGGLVTNTGGVLSHAAVVAREFGLPAVVGTGDATTRIADGRMVEIDGTAGTVRLL